MALVRPLLIVAALALLALPLRSHAGGAAGNLHALVLVPGYESNQLEAKLTAAYVPPAPACVAGQKQGWFQLWPNHSATRDASQVPCFADQMRLVYDSGADDYRNSNGVATRVPFFGSTRSLVG
nr:unnamed protein product [Digitaria exilis]